MLNLYCRCTGFCRWELAHQTLSHMVTWNLSTISPPLIIAFPPSPPTHHIWSDNYYHQLTDKTDQAHDQESQSYNNVGQEQSWKVQRVSCSLASQPHVWRGWLARLGFMHMGMNALLEPKQARQLCKRCGHYETTAHADGSSRPWRTWYKSHKYLQYDTF